VEGAESVARKCPLGAMFARPFVLSLSKDERTDSDGGPAMPFWVYMLKCADGSFYTGHTEDLECRVASHQSGQIPGYTRKRRPIRLVYSEAFASRLEALEAERRLKGWSRAKKQALVAGDWQRIAALARSRRD